MDEPFLWQVLAELQLLPTGAGTIAGGVEIPRDKVFIAWAGHINFIAVGVGPDNGVRVEEVNTNDTVGDGDDLVV